MVEYFDSYFYVKLDSLYSIYIIFQYIYIYNTCNLSVCIFRPYVKEFNSIYLFRTALPEEDETLPYNNLYVSVRNFPVNANYRDIKQFFGKCLIHQFGIKTINNKAGRRTGQFMLRFVDDSAAIEVSEILVISIRVCFQGQGIQ